MAGISRQTHGSYPFRRQVRRPAGRAVALPAWALVHLAGPSLLLAARPRTA